MNYKMFCQEMNKAVNAMLEKDMTSKLHTSLKNNGKEKVGLIIEEVGIKISPVIYLEEYYDNYLKGKSISQLADEIREFYYSLRREGVGDYKSVFDYDRIKEKILFKLINTKKNSKFLKGVPHKRFLDMSIVFYVLLSRSDEQEAIMTVTNSHIKQWEVSTDSLWERVVENIQIIAVPSFCTMESVLAGMMAKCNPKIASQKSVNLLEHDTGVRDTMFILSNSSGSYGAASIAYPHIADEIGEMLKSDYYILPSSIHELVVLPYSDKYEIAELNRMIRNINKKCVPDDEVLGEQCYRYLLREKRIVKC